MPKLDRWILAVLGLLLAAVFLTVGPFALNKTSLAGTDQAPIDPLGLNGNFELGQLSAVFHNRTLPAPATEQLTPPPVDQIPDPSVLGLNDAEKIIYVNLSKQTVYAFEGNKMVYEFLISSGKWGKTPTGTFTIWGKFRYTKMSGGNKALHTYYYLPNVPYVMFFSNNEIAASRGFSLHGTYWHNNFGHPMSHGCVNMKTEDAEKLFYWTTPSTGEKTSARATTDDPGTKVIIYGEAPLD